MNTTEKEAKFCFCPLLTTPDGKLRFCQGSQCMMWRWMGEDTGAEAPGFCGLASAPVSMARAGRTGGFLHAAPAGKPDDPFA